MSYFGRFVTGAIALALSATAAVAQSEPPPAPREFRAAWVATVANIDWPSKPGLSTWQQQAEAIAILDRCVELNMNAVVFQIRTTADALYASKYEPWSQYLTGIQGRAPSPYYDPLEFWIREAHARGIEVHAWFNPYRARHRDSKVELAPTHISNTNPAVVKEYGGYLWLDPGEPAAVEHSLKVFMDVVERYDVDGIHIDDYFYPYPVANPDGDGELDFPDGPSWEKYKAAGGTLSRADWRRENVNKLIKAIYEGTKQRKPHVEFGISPFGIGRAGKVPGIRGFDQYEKLYADAALWLQQGWCDYFTPQLYWPIAQRPQSFPVLLKYWISENQKGRHIWPGMFTSRVIDDNRRWETSEVINQIAIVRANEPAATGHVHFSMKALMKDADLVERLKSTYETPALVPASPWLDSTPPAKPTATLEGPPGLKVIRLSTTEPAWQFAIWTRTEDGWKFSILPGQNDTLPINPGVSRVVISAVDRTGNESERVSVNVE